MVVYVGMNKRPLCYNYWDKHKKKISKTLTGLLNTSCLVAWNDWWVREWGGERGDEGRGGLGVKGSGGEGGNGGSRGGLTTDFLGEKTLEGVLFGDFVFDGEVTMTSSSKYILFFLRIRAGCNIGENKEIISLSNIIKKNIPNCKSVKIFQ